MKTQPVPRPKLRGASRWPGLVFGGIGLVGFSAGLGLTVERVVIFFAWPEIEARVIESRVEPIGNQHRAIIRVEFDFRAKKTESEPASDYRSNNYGWIAEAVDRFPVGGAASVHHHWSDPQRTRLDVGFNFNTFGLPLLLVGAGLLFWGVGALATRSARLEHAESNARSRAEAARLARAQYLGVAAFVGVIGLASVGAGAALLRPAWATRQWPVITARVERTDIITRSSFADKHSSTTFYVGRLYVGYEFDGRTHRSVISLGKSSSDRAVIERLLAGIALGEPRDVRVDPNDPYQIVPADSWPLVLPGVFFFVGVVVSSVAVLVLRSAPKTRETAVSEARQV